MKTNKISGLNRDNPGNENQSDGTPESHSPIKCRAHNTWIESSQLKVKYKTIKSHFVRRPIVFTDISNSNLCSLSLCLLVGCKGTQWKYMLHQVITTSLADLESKWNPKVSKRISIFNLYGQSTREREHTRGKRGIHATRAWKVSHMQEEGWHSPEKRPRWTYKATTVLSHITESS